MEYLVRMVQYLESFRRPELEALANLADIDLKIASYYDNSPFCVVSLEDESQARQLIGRSILSKAVFELWGIGQHYDELHQSVKQRSSHLWSKYKHSSFKFVVDPFQHRRDAAEQRDIINSFRYVGFEGPIKMKGPEQIFCVFEEYAFKSKDAKQLFFGRLVAEGARDEILKYDLKKRKYISTTSMDAELALITANMAMAAPGKIFFDPFVGTGSFIVACSHFGACTLGSDIDGRSIRGKSQDRSLKGNFQQYHLDGLLLDTFVSDLTNTPLRKRRYLDGIICDPPYGVREGLKVLGSREDTGKTPILINGKPSYLDPSYVPPKKPYSFSAMLDDILEFAAQTLMDDARLSMWMPTANEQSMNINPPSHPCLELLHVSDQCFAKWSRRLMTYRRLPDGISSHEGKLRGIIKAKGNADELNPFRKLYFEGFKQV